jgi:heme exporter protein CcmD
MDFSAPHTEFVLASYGLSALALLSVALWIMLRDRKTRDDLRKLEKT